MAADQDRIRRRRLFRRLDGTTPLQQLMADIREGSLDVVVVYKVDRLTRSLADFARMVELFDAQRVSFAAVTQQFNTTTSMGG